MNQSDLVHLNTLLFLQSLLDGQHLIFRLKVEGLLTARQGFDKNLCAKTNKQKFETWKQKE